jgi:hypothetical protein
VEESGVYRYGFDGDSSCKDNVVVRDYHPAMKPNSHITVFCSEL